MTGIASGSPVITYTIPSGGCYSVFPMSVKNTLPAAIGGTPTVCAGSTTTLTETSIGGTWASSNSYQASVNSTGLVTGLLAGNPTISYTLPGGCSAVVPVLVNPLPTAIVGTPNACVGSTTSLTDVTGGGAWSSSNPSVAAVGTSTGVVNGIASGSSNIAYTLSSTGCSIVLPVAVNLLPAVFTVTGGGGYCSGSGGIHIGLSGSAAGVNYNLYQGSTYITTVPGTTAGIDFGLMPAVGTYTVQATDATTFCSSNMSGSTTVLINPLPTAYIFSAVGTGAYCAGTAGVDLQLSGSDAGVNYQLMMGPVAIGAPVPGSGLPGVLDLKRPFRNRRIFSGCYGRNDPVPE